MFNTKHCEILSGKTVALDFYRNFQFFPILYFMANLITEIEIYSGNISSTSLEKERPINRIASGWKNNIPLKIYLRNSINI